MSFVPTLDMQQAQHATIAALAPVDGDDASAAVTKLRAARLDALETGAATPRKSTRVQHHTSVADALESAADAAMGKLSAAEYAAQLAAEVRTQTAMPVHEAATANSAVAWMLQLPETAKRAGLAFAARQVEAVCLRLLRQHLPAMLGNSGGTPSPAEAAMAAAFFKRAEARSKIPCRSASARTPRRRA